MKIGSKKFTLILCIALVAVISFALILVLSSNEYIFKAPLSIEANDITLNEGESSENFYYVSNAKALVEFEAEDDSFFTIEQNVLHAIRAGKTTITLTASKNNKIAKTSFVLTVLTSNYSCQININNGGNIVDGNLYVEENVSCSFSVDLFDKAAQEINSYSVDVSITNGGTIVHELALFTFVTNQNCVITLEFLEIDFSFNINVFVE